MDEQERLGVLATDVRHAFDRSRFGIRRLPVAAGHLDPSGMSGLPCCLNMLIKTPGGEPVLPEPYRSHHEIISFTSACLRFEDGLLHRWRETYWLYLTVDCREVPAGLPQRGGGWHFDGMQGSRYRTKLPGCHVFLAASREPTEFSGAETDAATLDEDNDNWFKGLGRQVPADGPVWRPEAGQIVAFSAYQIHRSPAVRHSGPRALYRLDVSLKVQNDLVNTLNPDLHAPFPYEDRSIPSHLRRESVQAGWDGAERFGLSAAEQTNP